VSSVPAVGGLLGDPRIGFVELDPTAGRDLGDQQVSSLPEELVLHWRGPALDPPALPTDTVADDLGETARTPYGKLRLRHSVTPRPRLNCGRRVGTKRALNLLQLRLAGEGAQRVVCAIEWERHLQPALEGENERLRLTLPRLPRFDTADAVRGVDDEVADRESKC
jgi:hypothetical protein